MKSALGIFYDVFSRWPYLLTALLITLAIFLAVALLPNISLLNDVFSEKGIPLDERVLIVVHLLKSTYLNDSLLAFLVICLVSLVAGINGALIAYILKKRINSWRQIGIGIAGIAVSFLGLGCAACGSLIIAGLAYVGGLTPFILSLPFEGNELEVLGLMLMLISLIVLIRQMGRPAVC